MINMYSPFSSTSNGCDSCSTLDDAFGPSMASNNTAQVNQLLTQMTQNGVMNQHANTVMMSSATQPQVVMQQQPQVVMQPVAVPNVATVAANNAQAAQAKQAMNNMVAKAVGQVANNVAAVAVAEGFQANTPQLELGIPGSMMFMNLGFVILAALACNEAFKYYLNKAIQSAEGQTHYYLAYAVMALLLVVGAHYYTKRNM
jgi:hypothetical protein